MRIVYNMMNTNMALKKRINSLLNIRKILNNVPNNEYIYSLHKIIYSHKKGLYSLILSHHINSNAYILRRRVRFYTQLLQEKNVYLLNIDTMNHCILLGFSIWIALIPKILLSMWTLPLADLIHPIALTDLSSFNDTVFFNNHEKLWNLHYMNKCTGVDKLEPFIHPISEQLTDNDKQKMLEAFYSDENQFDPLNIKKKHEGGNQYNMKKLIIGCITICLLNTIIYNSELVTNINV